MPVGYCGLRELTANYRMPAPSFGGRLDFYGEYSHCSKSYSGAGNNEIADIFGSRNVVNAISSATSMSGAVSRACSESRAGAASDSRILLDRVSSVLGDEAAWKQDTGRK